MTMSLLMSLGLAAASTATPATGPQLRTTARTLVASCETAVRSGDWVASAAPAPDRAIARMDAAMTRGADAIVAAMPELVDAAVAAIAAGDWTPDGETMTTIVDASVLVKETANPDEASLH